MARCRRFLDDKAPEAAQRAAGVITDHIRALRENPEMGRPLADQPELVIPFGDAGYVALYHHEPAEGAVYILAFRHQKEAGY
jgi:plasmid stabilization system protein ParE